MAVCISWPHACITPGRSRSVGQTAVCNRQGVDIRPDTDTFRLTSGDYGGDAMSGYIAPEGNLVIGEYAADVVRRFLFFF